MEVAEVDINVYYSSEEELDTDTDSEIEFFNGEIKMKYLKC